MDIYRISQDLKFVNQIGQTLNIEEQLKLELAFPKITENQNIDQVLFWGKIEGSSLKDYYFAIGLKFQNQYEFPKKTFYWASSTDFVFAELPPFNQEYKDKVQTFRGLFTGQAEKILVNVGEGEEGEGGEPPKEEAEEAKDKQMLDSDEEDNKKVPPKNFTELDRLAYVVRAIDHDCSLVPLGAFKLTPIHELRYNDTFQGLSMEEGGKLQNYLHFRNVQSEEKKIQIQKDDALFQFDFLDKVEEDLPIGCWSIQKDGSKTQITIRSLLWPGYIGYHRTNSKTFGGAYFGSGIKNVDLPFML